MIARLVSSVLPDANIWASATLHAWFGLIAAESSGTWSFYWTEDIVAEAIRARRRRFPLSASRQMEDIRDRLITVIGDHQIKDFPIDSSVTYSDDMDAHVHSAAVYAGVGYLVTNNIKDFQQLYSSPDDCPYELYRADDWLMLAAESAPGMVDRVIQQHQAYRASRHKSSISSPI